MRENLFFPHVLSKKMCSVFRHLYHEFQISGGSSGNAVFGETNHNCVVSANIEGGGFVYGSKSSLVRREKEGKTIGIHTFADLFLNGGIADRDPIISQQILQRQLTVLCKIQIVIITFFIGGNPAFGKG